MPTTTHSTVIKIAIVSGVILIILFVYNSKLGSTLQFLTPQKSESEDNLPTFTPRRPNATPDVCPEEFDKSKCSKFYSGKQCKADFLSISNCKTTAPLPDLVTIILEPEGNRKQITNLQSSLRKRYNTSKMFTVMAAKNVKPLKTKYALVIPSTAQLLESIDIERQIRLIQDGVADVVAGGHVDSEARWATGCYQIEYTPYTATITEGYRKSYQSCIWCNFTTGPYVIRAKDLTNSTLDRFWFFLLKPNLRTLVCPDSLYHNISHLFTKPMIYYRNYFKSGSMAKELNRIKLRFHSFRRRETVNYNCSEMKIKCNRQKGLVIPLCCIKAGAKATEDVTRVLKETKVRYGLVGGSILGPLKFNHLLPWEVDVDIRVVDADAEIIFGMRSHFKKLGFTVTTFSAADKVQECVRKGNVHCAAFNLHRDGWRVELWGVRRLNAQTEEKRYHRIPYAKVSWGGKFLNTSVVNPARYARTLYQDDIFAHVEHPSQVKWDVKHPGMFSKCPRPGFHGCLENLDAYGTISTMEWLED